MTLNASRQLLDAARRVQVVTPMGKSQGRKRLLTAMATGTITVTALTAEASLASAALASTGGAAAPATSSLVSLAASAVAVGVLAGTLVLSPGSEPNESRQAVYSKPMTHFVATNRKPEPPLRVQLPAMTAEPRPAAPPAPTASTEVSFTVKRERPSIEEETRLLQRAQGAQRRGLYADALQLLVEYERRFTAPRLGEEAMALRVLVHCQSGNLSTAKRWAALFTEQYASSAQLGRLKTTCPQAFVVSRKSLTESH